MKYWPTILLIEGVLWGAAMSWLLLSIASIADPVSSKEVLLELFVLLLGPLLLVLGPIMFLVRWHQQAGAILAFAGTIILTIIFAVRVYGAINVPPLQSKPPLMIYFGVFALAIISSYGAFRMIRFSQNGATNSDLRASGGSTKSAPTHQL